MRNNILVVFSIILILFCTVACGTSTAESLQKQIKPGMTAAEVADLLRSNKDGHYNVKISGKDEIMPFSEFEKVFEKIREQEDTHVAVNVLFMGPGFSHNEFDILLDSEGKVESVTPLKKWD